MRLIVVLTALVLASIAGVARGQAVFTDIEAGLEPVSYCSVAWGDFDGDGDLDLGLSGETWWGWVTRIYRNDAGSFTGVGSGLVGYKYSAVAWSDYDRDGDLDFTVMGLTWNSVVWLAETKIYRNDGGAIFNDANANIGGVRFGSLAWGDCDNDGDPDLALAGSAYTNPSTPMARIFRHDPEWFFGLSTGLTGVDFASVAWADYDKDGDLDLALAGWNLGPLTRVYRNNGSAGFSNSGVALEGVWRGALAWGDYDNDGWLDLAVAPAGKIYRNTGDGGFADINAGLPAVQDSALAWGDYDNDGDLDIALTGRTPSGVIARLYRNDGSGVFADTHAAMPAVEFGSLAWGDYDFDGDLDLAIAGLSESGRISRILRNESDTPNVRPSSPGGLSASVSDTEVTFTWSAAADPQTPSGGLSYNLRVRTSSGTADVLSGMADSASGRRLLPALGNAQSRLSWTLKGLAPGAYYWSVQAIDAAYAGSLWAEEVWFVTARAPVDFDGDGDVDADDLGVFAACVSGPAIPHLESAACGRADVNEDGDVDQDDFGVFQRCISDADRPADPACAEG